MAEIARWTFFPAEADYPAADRAGPDGHAPDAGVYGSARPQDGQDGGMPAPEGGQHVEIPADAGFQVGTGTVEIRFTQIRDIGVTSEALISRDSPDADESSPFSMWVSGDGRVGARHVNDEDSAEFSTPAGFLAAGDEVTARYSWDYGGTHGAFTVENHSTGAHHSEPVPDTLSMDMGPDDRESWTIGAGSQESGDGSTGNSLHHAAAGIDYVSIRDDAAPDGTEPLADDGPAVKADDAAFEMNVSEGGDSDGTGDTGGACENGETLIGTDGDDELSGTDCDDEIYGGAGDDTVFGGAGDDVIFGGSGADVLHGGAGNDTIYAGDGGSASHSVTLTFEGSTAGYANTLGYYYIDPETGEITGAGIAFTDSRAEFGGGDLVPGESRAQFEIPEGAQVGTFLIADGGNRNDFEALGEGEFVFLNADGDPATLDDPAPQLVHVAPDGTQTALEGNVWHSAAHGDHVGLNSDDAVHVRGISENEDGTWTFGYEDLQAQTWDADFTDVQFTVDLGQSGAVFLNPDYDARAPSPEDEAGGNLIFGDEGDDLIHSSAGADTVDGGAGDDTIIGTPGDEIGGGDGYDTLVIEGDRDNIAGVDITNEETNPDGSVSQDGVVRFHDGTDLSFTSIERIVPCFTPGTLIDTDEGRIPVEELFVGDRVLTRDRGFRSLVWVGAKEVTPEELAARPAFAPVRIARGALGDQLPERDMLVSPQHRMLVSGARAELMFGESEVLVAARHLIGLPGITRAIEPVTYIHVMCDRHEIVRADGCWSESFQPGDLSLAGLDGEQRAEIFGLFPELAEQQGRRAYQAARMTLKAHEARVLIGM